MGRERRNLLRLSQGCPRYQEDEKRDPHENKKEPEDQFSSP